MKNEENIFDQFFDNAPDHLNGEKNRQNQLYAQIMSQREQSDSTLRAQMFDSLIKSYLGGKVEKDPDKQIVYLHLLALNFQEFFDAKPLFEELDKKLPEEKREELRKIAKKIASKQVALLTRPEDEIPDLSLTLVEGEGKTNQDEFKLKAAGSSFTFGVELLSIGLSSAKVRVTNMATFEPKPLDLLYPFMICLSWITPNL